MDDEFKICCRCGLEKTIGNFYKQNKKKADGARYIYYNPECKECTKEAATKRQKGNEEYYEYLKQYKKENKESYQKQVDLWFSENKEYRKDYQKNYQKENKDKFVVYQKERNLHKKHEISKKEWEACKIYFNNSCAYCGISEEEAKKEYGHNLHMEHAVNDGKNDLSNCIPSCRSCNSKKNIKDFSTWYNKENDRFSAERLHKINEWLENDYNLYKE